MHAIEATTETTLVTERARAAPDQPLLDLDPPEPPSDARLEPSEPASQAQDGAAEAPSQPEDADVAGAARADRRKLEEQLEALKRKELELRRALVIADHPALADAIRSLEGRAYALGRVEAKLAQGLSKAEERRRETLTKKLASLYAKRSELDAQIAVLETEQQALGAERTEAFETERRHALEQLLVALGTHEPALHAAGIDASSLVPDLSRWLPEVQALAESYVAAK